MATLSKKHTVTRKVTLKGVTDDGKDADFIVTYRSLPDDELFPLLNRWPVGYGVEEGKTQRECLDLVIEKASSKAAESDEAARDFLVNGSFAVRAAMLADFQQMLGAGILQKN